MGTDRETLELTETSDGVLVPLKVVPGASRDRIIGVLGGALKVSVAAPPEKGRANQAVVRLFAKALGLRRNQVAVVQGTTTPRKVLAVCGATPDDVRGLLR